MVEIKTWNEAQEDSYGIREEVFIHEQGVPESLELDEFDEIAWHALVYLDQIPVATSRMVREELDDHRVLYRIGRMAVLREYRGCGYGSDMMQALLKYGQSEGVQEYYLHAQTYAVKFYEQFGFIAEGDEFEEAGIPHLQMRLKK